MAPHQPQRSSFESLDDNSDHSDDDSDQHEAYESVNENRSTTGNTTSSYQEPQPFSDQKHLSNGHSKGNKKRPTHFLCFPLVTNSSVPQLSQSLSKFQGITTAPLPAKGPTRDERETPERDDQDNPSQATASNGIAHQLEDDRLRLIPQSAYRPAGTFHLTIGTMDLSEKSEMQRALNLLKAIDYVSLLRDVDGRLLTSRTMNGGFREIALDATNPATDKLSTSTSTLHEHTQGPNANGISNGNIHGVNGYRETVSRIDRAILHATPDFTAAKREKRELNPDPYSNNVSKIDRAILHATPENNSTSNSASNSTSNTNTNGTPTPTASPKIIPNANPTTSSPSPQINFEPPSRPAATSAKPITSRLFRPSVQLPSSETINSAGNILGVSGYKETVSSVDRYVDKTYEAAAKAKKVAARKDREREKEKTDAEGRKSGRERGLSLKNRILNRGARSASGTGPGGAAELNSLRRSVSPPASVSTAHRRLLDDNASMATGTVGDGESLYTVTSNSTRTPRASIAVGAGAPTLSLSSTAEAAAVAEPQAPPAKLEISLRGLGVFPNAKNARVFYAPPVDEGGRLQLFAEEIARLFVQEGLVSREERASTLHATVANLRYASSARGGRGGRGRRGGWKGKGRGKGERVDASAILDFFNSKSENGEGREFVWAEGIQVDRVRICKMGAEKSADEVLGMVYPAVEIDVGAGEGEGGEEGRKEMERAEVVFA